MDANFFSHLVFAFVGLLTLAGAVSVVGALFSMGRQGYGRD